MKYLSYLTCLFLIFNIMLSASPSKQQRGFHSQASQDAFVYTLLYHIEKKTDKGYYLEIGSGPPIFTSNTYFLEKNLNWQGISLDIATEYRDPWFKSRRNPLLITDATTADYSLVLKQFPKMIDYLSLDIDGQYDTVLRQIPFDQYTFKIITIEHDSYRFGENYKNREREILKSFGYHLLCPDVMHHSVGAFEDWWIHPSGFSAEALAMLTSLNLNRKYHDEIVSLIISSLPH